MSPVLPQDVKALIISDSDSWCVAFAKMLNAVYLRYKWKKYTTKEDGTIADAWAADICANTICPDTPTS